MRGLLQPHRLTPCIGAHFLSLLLVTVMTCPTPGLRPSPPLTFHLPSPLLYLRKSLQQFSLLPPTMSVFPFTTHVWPEFISLPSFKPAPHLASRIPTSPGFIPTSLAVPSLFPLLVPPPLPNLGPRLGTLLFSVHTHCLSDPSVSEPSVSSMSRHSPNFFL